MNSKRTALNALATTVIISLAGFAQAQTIKLETYAGPKHAMNAVAWPEWTKQIEKDGAGLKIRMTYPPISPLDLYDRVKEGIGDVSWTNHATGRFVLTELVELPGHDGNAEQMSVAYWRIYTKHFAKFDEHKGVKLLTLFTHGPGMIHSSKPIQSTDALNGMKMQIGAGMQGMIGRRLGIVSISAPVSQAQELLAQGVADGVFFSIETIWSFRLGDVLKYHYSLPGGLYNSSFFVVMNQRKFDSLSADQQKVISKYSGEHLSRLIGATWDDADKLAVKELTNKGNTVTDFAPQLAQAIKAKLAGLDDEWIARAKGVGVADPAAVLREFRAEIQNVKQGK